VLFTRAFPTAGPPVSTLTKAPRDVTQNTHYQVDSHLAPLLGLSHRQGNSPKAKTKDRREAGKPPDPNDVFVN